MTHAAIYIRKSRKDGDKPAHRLTVQREQLPAYARSQGWDIVTYDDGHASAARGKTDDLRERARLEADIEAGRINVILVIELSRLSRDDSLQDYVAWLHLCATHRVKLSTMSRILDPSQHSDWMLLLMEGGFSSVEMKVLQARMKEGRDEAFRAGRYLGGPVPAPYVYDKGQGKPVIETAALAQMKRLWELAEAMSARRVAIQMGLPHITVRRAISDERLLFYQALRRDPKSNELIVCDWQPCMTAAQAEAILANRKNGRRGYARNTAASLLSNLGLFVCGYCGRSVRAWGAANDRPNHRGAHPYYGCKANETARACEKSRMLRQETIDERIITNLIGTLEHLNEIRDYWMLGQDKDDHTERLRALDDEERAQTTKKQRLVAAVADGVVDFADAKALRLQIENGLEDIRRQRAELQASDATEPDWESIAITQEEFAELDLEEKRLLISQTIRRIRLHATYMLIDYHFPRTAEGDTQARVHLPPALVRGRRSTNCNTPK